MDLYEQLVGIYLTVFEHLAVIPQFPVIFDDQGAPCFEETPGKHAPGKYPDHVAFDIKKRQAHVVQVRKARIRSAALKVAHLLIGADADINRERIEHYIKWFAGEDFTVQWRFLVRAEHVKALEALLQQAGQTRTTVNALS